ncbi:MAG TPA: hypothetical protein VEZ19_09330 [Rubrobacter sp.]|jgi:hypothetical protein|nr:hypothetical protein [Rubrobacter sp.]
MESSRRRRRVEPTDEWEQIELLCGWPEQRAYELIRPMVLFGAPANGRSEETGASSGRTLRRNMKIVVFGPVAISLPFRLELPGVQFKLMKL